MRSASKLDCAGDGRSSENKQDSCNLDANGEGLLSRQADQSTSKQSEAKLEARQASKRGEASRRRVRRAGEGSDRDNYSGSPFLSLADRTSRRSREHLTGDYERLIGRSRLYASVRGLFDHNASEFAATGQLGHLRTVACDQS